MFKRFHAYHPKERVAIGTVVVLAFVSIATGVLAIMTEPDIRVSGFVDTIESIAVFSGTIIGFALLVTAWGMQRGYRLAYIAASVLVFLAAAHGIVQLRLLSIPLVVLSIGGLIVLVLTNRQFVRRASISDTQLGGLGAIVGVLCYGTAGTYTLRAGFDEIETVFDALYFTLITATTVGYGDIHPLTEEARLFVTSLAILGPATIAATAGSLASPVLKTQLARVNHRDADSQPQPINRKKHVVVLGYSELAKPIISELVERTSVVVVTEKNTTMEHGDVITGDPLDKNSLEWANIETATAVVVVMEREVILDAIRAVRDVQATVHLVAVTDIDDQRTLEHTGANNIINPQTILGSVTADAALNGNND